MHWERSAWYGSILQGASVIGPVRSVTLKQRNFVWSPIAAHHMLVTRSAESLGTLRDRGQKGRAAPPPSGDANLADPDPDELDIIAALDEALKATSPAEDSECDPLELAFDGDDVHEDEGGRGFSGSRARSALLPRSFRACSALCAGVSQLHSSKHDQDRNSALRSSVSGTGR